MRISQEAKIVSVASGLTCLAGMQGGWIGPLIPSIARAQHLTLVEAGLIVSVNMVGAMIMNVLGKFLVDKFGGPNCMKAASFVMALGLAGLGFSQGFYLLCLSGLTWGLGAGLNGMASTTTILANADKVAASALNRLNVFFGVGALLGPAAAWAAITYKLGYPAVFALGSCWGLIMMCITLTFKPESAKVQKREQDIVARSMQDGEGQLSDSAVLRSRQKFLRQPALWLFAFIIFLYVGMEASCSAWLFTFLQKQAHLNMALCSISMSTLWIGLTLGRLFSVSLTKRFSPFLISAIAACCVIVAVTTLCAIGRPGVMALAVVLLLGMGFGPIYPNNVASANQRFKQNLSTTSMIVITAGSIGGTLIPMAVGYAFTKIGMVFGMSSLAVLAFLLLSTVGLLTARPRAVRNLVWN